MSMRTQGGPLHMCLPSEAGFGNPRSHKVRLAMLVSPSDMVNPSSYSSLGYFTKVAELRGMEATLIGPQSLDQLRHFDALFIRMTTSVAGVAHRFSLRALKLGLPVIDDPQSIVRGSNKIIQHEILKSHGIPMPRTITIGSSSQAKDCASQLGLPVVFKIIDGSFCRGVEKAETTQQCEEIAGRLLALGGPILAQEFMPTRFDWRIGVLDGRAIFACKYHMVHDHWQVVARSSKGTMINGPVEAIALNRVPSSVVSAAIKSAACIGDGFYGVDIKDTLGGPVVIEVNDNPDLDVDAETVANPEAWEILADWFVSAVASRQAENVTAIRVLSAG